MMSPENIRPPAPETNATSGNRKTTSQQQRQQEQPPAKCPRCDSFNTKFCYYNNYSLTQPRHFCKTCRRYWTKGGALRNVPIGGGCRKTTRKTTSSSSPASSSALFSGDLTGEFRFLPAVEFKLHPATAGVYSQFITGAADFMGLNYPIPAPAPSWSEAEAAAETVAQGNSGGNQISVSSIESLRSMNQEMHWKLQRQRLALFYEPSLSSGGDGVYDYGNQKEKPAPINWFQNWEVNYVE